MPQVFINSPASVPVWLDRGNTVIVSPVANTGAVCYVTISAESIVQSVAIETTFGPYTSAREVAISLVYGRLAYEVKIGGAGGGSVSLDSMNTAFTAGTPTQQAAFQASVSGGAYFRLRPTMAPWIAAKARGGSNPARHMILGDSNIAGVGAGTGTANSVGARPLSMGVLMGQALGQNVQAWFCEQRQTAVNGVTLPQYDPRIAINGTGITVSANTSFGGNLLQIATAATGTLDFTPTITFDTILIPYWRTPASGLGFTVKLNGTQVYDLSQNGAEGFAVAAVPVTRGTGTITLGSHATSSGYVNGLIVYDSTAANTPIALIGGYCGGKAADFANTATTFANLNAAKSLIPDFTSIYCTVNDINVPTATDAYRASLETVISNLSVTSTGALYVGYPTTAVSITDGTLDKYAAALRSLAGDYGWGFADSREIFGGSNARTNVLGYKFDASHPNAAGHAAWATWASNVSKSWGI
jgi:lysophospholipase L1-like esterase